MTALDPAKARALLADATQGPFHVERLDDGLADDDGAIWCVCHPNTSCDATTFANFFRREDADLCAAAMNALPHLLSVAERETWQPIETAPKDGTVFLACWVTDGGPYFGAVQWQYDGWVENSEPVGLPTHWMPLPAPPTPTEGEGA